MLNFFSNEYFHHLTRNTQIGDVQRLVTSTIGHMVVVMYPQWMQTLDIPWFVEWTWTMWALHTTSQIGLEWHTLRSNLDEYGATLPITNGTTNGTTNDLSHLLELRTPAFDANRPTKIIGALKITNTCEWWNVNPKSLWMFVIFVVHYTWPL